MVQACCSAGGQTHSLVCLFAWIITEVIRSTTSLYSFYPAPSPESHCTFKLKETHVGKRAPMSLMTILSPACNLSICFTSLLISPHFLMASVLPYPRSSSVRDVLGDSRWGQRRKMIEPWKIFKIHSRILISVQNQFLLVLTCISPLIAQIKPESSLSAPLTMAVLWVRKTMNPKSQINDQHSSSVLSMCLRYPNRKPQIKGP